MQAIQTRWLCATNNKPSRIKASCESGSITVSVGAIPNEHSVHHEDQHIYAAHLLIDKLQKELEIKFGKHQYPFHHCISSGECKGNHYHCFNPDFSAIMNDWWVEYLNPEIAAERMKRPI